jgi:hypothetical protein
MNETPKPPHSPMLDEHSARHSVEINIDRCPLGDTLWVNVDGICRYRLTNIHAPIKIQAFGSPIFYIDTLRD